MISHDRQSITGLFADFRVLVMLFIVFRVGLLLAYQPFLLNGQERGVSVGGDRAYHYALTEFVADEQLPFRDWWSEFPPVWYLLTSTIYALLGNSATYDNWSLVLGGLMIASEVGILTLVRRLGTQLHGANTGMALAWVYALLVAPVVFMWWNFDSLVTLFALLALSQLLSGTPNRSAISIAIGALVKFVPFLWAGVVIRFYSWRESARIIGVAVVVFVLVYLPFFAVNSEFALISLTAQFNKPSYQTVWALLDGNTTTGNFGSVESHFSADGVSDGVSDKRGAVVPSIIRLGGALLIGAWIFYRTRRIDRLGVVAFAGITLILFYLQSQGWSPQWLTLILPLILLVFPTRDGVYVASMLTLLAFMEYPFLFIRTGDTGGQILPSSTLYGAWVMLVLTRTLLLIGVCVAFYRKLRQFPNPELALNHYEGTKHR